MCNALDCSVKEDVPLNLRNALILCNKVLFLNVNFFVSHFVEKCTILFYCMNGLVYC